MRAGLSSYKYKLKMKDAKKLKEQLAQERNELNVLINKGMSFEVQDVEVQYKKYMWGLFKLKKLVSITRKFVIKEPTLGTLDRLSAEWLEFAVDDMTTETINVLSKARELVANNAERCARIIAIAVLGTDLLVPHVGFRGVVTYTEDTEKLDELTRLFIHKIKPSELYQIFLTIDTMCNLGDFINSIRLMSIQRTTMPIRVEENKEG